MENSIICVVVVTIIIVIMARFQLDVTPMYLLSEQNAGQKYKYRIMFKLQSCKISNCFFIQMHYIKVYRHFLLQGV